MGLQMTGNEYRHGIKHVFSSAQFFHPEMPGRGHIPRDEFIPIAIKFLKRTAAITVA